MNTLYYGDNLDILKRYIKDESVDLVYLDPPFNSNATYNVLFAQKDGSQSSAQIRAFEDTWQWDENAIWTYEAEVEKGGPVADGLRAFKLILGDSNMMAYLTMMAPRLQELRRVLKPTGSLYLHCDPTASHYLKVLLDMVFGAENYRNEITWKRTFAHGNVGRNFGKVTDIILWYTKGEIYTWNQLFTSLSEKELSNKYPFKDLNGRRWQSVTLRNPSLRPNLMFPFTASNGITYQPHPNGWSCNLARLQLYDREKRLQFPVSPNGALRLKMYEDESQGEKLQNFWGDISPIGALAAERLGYPTQKPIALLERIIQASSDSGGVVLDPFCGCGTAVAAAQKLGRQWIGIDITHLAISLMKRRLEDAFGSDLNYRVIGEPTTYEEALSLATQDKYQFQWWSLGLIGARPVDEKRGADHGIDGRLYFHDDASGQTKQVVISVKGGGTNVAHVRDLKGILEREKSQMGVLITMDEPSKPMRAEAASGGFYESPWGPNKYPRVQILTIHELLDGKRIDMPPISQVNQTFRRAPKQSSKQGDQPTLISD